MLRANVIDSDQERLLSLRHFRSESLPLEQTIESVVQECPEIFPELGKEERMQWEMWR